MARLGDCCEIVSGATPRRNVPEYWGNDVPWVTPKDLSDLDTKILADAPEYISDAGYRSCSSKLMPAGSVLFSSRAPIGLVAIAGREMCTNQGFKSLVPGPDVHSDFLYYWLKANRDAIAARGNGATFKEISGKVMGEIEIPLPPLPEQKRIAKILDAADALRAKRRESLAQLDALLQSTFLEMFGDPVENPKRWPIVPMGDACDVRDGTHDSPKYQDSGFPLLTSKNFRNGRIDYEGAALISEEDFRQINRRSKVDIGDLVMPMIGTIGNPVLVIDEPKFAIKNVALIKFSPNSPDNYYVRTLLTSHYFDHITSKSNRGGTQKFVALKDLRSLPLPTPPSDAQQKFRATVCSIEQHAELNRTHASHLDTLFASLQQRAFAGQL